MKNKTPKYYSHILPLNMLWTKMPEQIEELNGLFHVAEADANDFVDNFYISPAPLDCDSV